MRTASRGFGVCAPVLRARPLAAAAMLVFLLVFASVARASGPAVTSVTVPGNGTYVAGQDLDFTATFSETVTVTGTPRIPIMLTPLGTVYADYVSGSGTNTLTFRHTVAPGEQDLTGITTGSSIDLNGGSIIDAFTQNAQGTALNLTGEPSLAGVDVDAIVPAVSSVVVPINGTYGTGQNLDFTVDFTKVVTVDTGGGIPYIQITLDTGGTVDAVYQSGSGSTSLVFRYVIASGELDTTGITVGSSIVLSGGTIQDSVGNNTDTTLNGVGSTTGVLVDSIAPTVTSIDTVAASTNNLSTEQFTVTFSTPVAGVDASDFTPVGTGTVSGSISAVSGSAATWTVTVGSVTGDGTLRLDLNTGGSTITDAYGNALMAGHTGDQTYTIEHTPPSATSMTVPANGTYGSGQSLDFTVTFSEPVTVNSIGGTPRIAITLDTGGTVYANSMSGSGTNTLTFRFTPVAGEQDLTGIVTGTAIDANGGTIQDAATNNAAGSGLNLVGEPSTAGIDVDAILPAVVSVGVPASTTYIAGQDLDFTVNLSKAVTVDTSGGTPYIPLTLTTGGTVDAQYLSGSGTSTLTFRYIVAPGEQADNDVAVGSAIVLQGGTIQDGLGNNATLTLNGVGSTTGVLVDSIPPTVTSINTVEGSPNDLTSEDFTVTFSEAVAGVAASDFTLHTTGSVSGTIASVTPVSGSVYTVTVTGVTGHGTLRLDLNSSGTGITDLATNPIATGFTGGQVYTIALPQSIAFPSTGVTYGQMDFGPASAGSGLAVSYSNPVGQCAIDAGGLVQITGAGSCTVTAGQPGNVDYQPATSVTQTFAISQAVVHVDANPASKSYGSPDPAPSGVLRAADFKYSDTAATSAITGSAGCQITSHSENAGTYPGAITCAAGSLSSANYTFVAGNADELTIAQASQSITFTSTAPAHPAVGGSYMAAAAASTGLPVSLSIDSSSGAGVCSVAGAAVSFLGAGSCVIDANQAGNGDYLAAAQVHQVLTIAAAAPSASVLDPVNGATYTLGQKVLAGFSCSDGASGSGISTCTGTVADGKPIDTSTLGQHTFKVMATSIDGQSAFETVSYTVTQPPPPTVGTSGSPSTSAQGMTVLVDPGIKLSCPADGGACSSDETAIATVASAARAKTKFVLVGSAHFSTPAGKQRELTFKLNGRGVRLLHELRHLRATVTVFSRAGNGKQLTTTKTITIKPPPPKHTHR